MARDFCFSKGGDLAVITSQLEFDTVVGYFNESADRGTWLGGVYNDTIGTWKWINGEPWGFQYFETGEVFQAGDCLVLRNKGKNPERQWVGQLPDKIKYVICETGQ